MSKVTKIDSRFKMVHEGYLFEYDDAVDLAYLMHSVGFRLESNPYDPDTKEYDQFNNVMYGKSKQANQ